MPHPWLGAAIVSILFGVGSCTVFKRDCALPETVCVGLVTGYGTVEAGIQHQAWLAMQDAVAGGKVDRIDHIDTIDTRDRAANIAFLAGAGYDIVVTTGAGIADETVAAARQYPELLFVIVQPGHEPFPAPMNLLQFEFREERGGFLAGAAAAMISQTHRVAAVCEARFIDYIERYCEGFAAGAHFIDSHAEADIRYRQSADELQYRDTEWGRATATQVTEDGADVVFAVGEETARAALREAARRGTLVIGAQADLFDEMPEIRNQLVTSVTLQVRSGLLSIIMERLSGQLPEGPYLGSVSLAPFHEYENQLAPGAVSRLLTIENELNGGRLDVNLPFDGP